MNKIKNRSGMMEEGKSFAGVTGSFLNNRNLLGFTFLFVESLLVFSVLFFFSEFALASIGGNATVSTQLRVGAVPPEILNITILDSLGGLNLNPNSTLNVLTEIIIRDFNGESGVLNVTGRFFDNVASSYGAADDNNVHYTNDTCSIDTSYGTIYEVNATCGFNVWYYANNATWNFTAYVTDNTTRTDLDSTTAMINQLLAVGLPDSLDYGEVNGTDVSDEIIANVTNFGNVGINITLEGYAVSQGDNLSMNCTLGNVQNISIQYEKYNLTASNNSILTLAQFESLYTNLTSLRTPRTFDLLYRQNDAAPYLDDTNSTYWRIYVPVGVAGTCTGNIIFGATREAGT